MGLALRQRRRVLLVRRMAVRRVLRVGRRVDDPRQSKVTDAERAVGANEAVLRLDVPVQHAKTVEVLDGHQQVPQKHPRVVHRHPRRVPGQFAQVASSELLDQVHVSAKPRSPGRPRESRVKVRDEATLLKTPQHQELPNRPPGDLPVALVSPDGLHLFDSHHQPIRIPVHRLPHLAVGAGPHRLQLVVSVEEHVPAGSHVHISPGPPPEALVQHLLGVEAQALGGHGFCGLSHLFRLCLRRAATGARGSAATRGSLQLVPQR
mmetsp:Transcript_11760/g.33956  ORF Transcript_11760/g.33956 Transcript_11760/m.33956 type:complete len:263 (-) Transcript_11760:198-986(-)